MRVVVRRGDDRKGGRREESWVWIWEFGVWIEWNEWLGSNGIAWYGMVCVVLFLWSINECKNQ
jgi:hypothetical protein